ncbi:nuclear export factor CRM1 [Rhizopus microsporus var. microsporus]|uniref:Nuclear export receptor Crm1 n=2 Tax=Rhizopus microsporus TaxID=58291 RepID=A0A2G4T0K7_RHIZD|nr:nuclear export receptor Crm1 [Rhizopus microsporus ATCC 52813]ORE03750.1 nuclear export factor CRM1 [Rhizopus microsporus var. microsporus]PHZ14549.1 nuclear export receptor Crm1 [Rhizopus microsporus ATCC 52813]
MAESILDFNKELDIALLDQVVLTFYTGSGSNQQMAQQLLTQFQDHVDAWTRADKILEHSNVPQTKFIALQILEKFITTRWNTLPIETKQAIRCFIVDMVIKSSSDEATLYNERTFINKLNMVLVQILKQDWPYHWPSFIPEIVASSKTNMSLCENNMNILKLLSEEIFDYSAEQMIHLKTSNLRQSICNEFSEIFHLCVEILDSVSKASLIKATLETLLRFLSWIPIGYIFETNLIQLLTKFMDMQQYRNVTLKCLMEIGSLSGVDEYNEKLLSLFTQVMGSINTAIPSNTDIASLYENSSNDDQQFIQNLALFLTSFLEAHVEIVERTSECHNLLNSAHVHLINISRIEDREVFKVCLEYWTKLVRSLYDEAANLRLYNHSIHPTEERPWPRKSIYADILSSLRVVMIEKMVKPEEVLIVENDEGEIVREFIKESDTIILYKNIKEVLVYLTNLDVADTEMIMTKKLQRQMDGSEWSWQNLNKLCWAIGSISGAMNVDTEKHFLVTVIKDLLSLCEQKRGKANKAVVASNVMYCVGQYPRFLKSHWQFLKIVIHKLFEFMHEPHEGVQDMACDTFIKISQECSRHFIIQQTGEVSPFIDEIIHNMEDITCRLTPQQVQTFYEAVGYMISAQSNKIIQEKLITKFMSIPNMLWQNAILSVKNSSTILKQPQQVKVLTNILKVNIAACSSIGHGYISQLGVIYSDMLELYHTAEMIIIQLLAEQGNIAVKTPNVRGLRSVRKDILQLINTFVGCATELDSIQQNMITPFFEVVLTSYNSSPDIIKEAYVLEVLANLVDKLDTLMIPHIPLVLESTFEPTLNMITKDFTEYPEHREGFYHLLRSINRHCFPALLELSPDRFKLIIDSIVWGFKHTLRHIADLSLGICEELIQNINATDSTIADAFYQSYYLSILQDIFFVLTDGDHKSGFKGQTEMLALLFSLVTTNSITMPLYNPSEVTDENMDNVKFLKDYVSTLLQNAFPHLKRGQITVFIDAMLEYNNTLPKFKLEVRDFLIQLKEFAGENTELYLEEKEAEMERKRREERENALRIPGMIKPSDLSLMG